MIPIYLITGDINFDHLGFVLRVCVCVCVCVCFLSLSTLHGSLAVRVLWKGSLCY